MERRAVIICHNDLDGYASAVCLKEILGYPSTIRKITYKQLDKVVRETMKDIFVTDVYILDLGIDESLAKLLEDSLKEVCVIDHHVMHNNLENYDWAYVKDYLGETKQCTLTNVINKCYLDGKITEWTYKRFYDKEIRLGKFVEGVREYDTFDYPKEITFEELVGKDSFKLNELFEQGRLSVNDFLKEERDNIHGTDKKPLDYVQEHFCDRKNLITVEDEDYLRELRQSQLQNYEEIVSKRKEITPILKDKRYKLAIIKSTDMDYSLAGYKFLRESKGVDAIIVLNGQKGSIRSLNGEALELANIFGGSGHLNATGFLRKNKVWRKIEEENKLKYF